MWGDILIETRLTTSHSYTTTDLMVGRSVAGVTPDIVFVVSRAQGEPSAFDKVSTASNDFALDQNALLYVIGIAYDWSIFVTQLPPSNWDCQEFCGFWTML